MHAWGFGSCHSGVGSGDYRRNSGRVLKDQARSEGTRGLRGDDENNSLDRWPGEHRDHFIPVFGQLVTDPLP